MEKIFTVNNILDILMRRLWLIVVLVCMGGGIAFTYSQYILPKKYTSAVTLYVYNQTEGRQLTTSDFSLSSKLVDTYMVILKSNYVLEKISDKVKDQNLNYSATEIGSMITSVAVDETEVFKISVSSYSKEDAKTIADAIAEIAPDEIIRVVKAGSVEIVDTAKLPTTYSSPNVPKNTIVGIILGLIFACVLALLLELMNTTVKSREDLMEEHKYPVLAVIPNLDGKTNRSYNYKRYGGRYGYSYYYEYGYGNYGKKSNKEGAGNEQGKK